MSVCRREGDSVLHVIFDIMFPGGLMDSVVLCYIIAIVWSGREFFLVNIYTMHDSSEGSFCMTLLCVIIILCVYAHHSPLQIRRQWSRYSGP